jgi:hypothetical protein
MTQPSYAAGFEGRHDQNDTVPGSLGSENGPSVNGRARQYGLSSSSGYVRLERGEAK